MHVSMSRTHCRKVTSLFSLAMIVLSHSDGKLIITPRNTESKVGETTYFNCSTDLKSSEIFWHHGNKDIYTGNGILEPYRGRFDIDRNASIGSHNLVIHYVEPGDAGEYICADDEGYRQRISVQLIVLENNPDCLSNITPDGVIGQNVFNIPPDEVELTCNVTYYGNIPPQMEWKKVGDKNSSIKDGVMSHATPDNRLVHTLQLIGDLALDNSSYICQTTRSTQNQYTCTSEIIKVLYFVGGNMIEQKVFEGDEINCVESRNTFPCINQWHYGNYTLNETITTHLLGEYLCKVKCRIRGTDYTFDALKAFVVKPKASVPEPGKSSATAVVLIIIIITVILAASIAVFVVRKMGRKIAQMKTMEQERFGVLLTMKDHKKTDETEKRNDSVAEEEIELLHKVKHIAGMILGMTLLRGMVFIVREYTSKLEVYDCNNINLGPKFIKVKALVHPVDMCSCKKNDCLYVINYYKTSHTEVLRFSTGGKLLKKWPTEDSLGTVSATVEGNVILTIKKTQMLLEYSLDGNLIRKINIQGCTDPWYAIKRENRYVVSHGSHVDPLNRVCIVDEEGQVEKSFGRERGSTESQLNSPCYFAVLSSGCVIVVDLLNDRVLLLDSDLEFKAIIVPKYRQRFLFPACVCLDEHRLVLLIKGGDPKNSINGEGDGSRNEKDGGTTSKENNRLLKHSDKWKIEEDCRILVFDIKPLLEKYDK